MLSKNQIKDLQALHLKKHRDAQLLFVAEGIKTVSEIINKKPGIIKVLYATEEYLKNNEGKIKKTGIKVEVVTEPELQKISLQSTPNHVMAVCHYFGERQVISEHSKSVCFYLDDIRDPGNFGTILRLAAWFGHQTIYCSPSSCDLYNPKVIQSTMGSFLTVNVVYTSLMELSAAVPIIYGAVLNGKSVYTEDLQPGIIVIGNEANGINEDNLKYVTNPITIPTGNKGGAESLNAAMAASIIASEFFRKNLI